MKNLRVDVAIIGAGTAGLNARRRAAAAGASTLLIEGGPYGTTCARVGCMPSKLLIAAADVAHEIRHAERFGIRLPAVAEIDGRAVMDRVRRERDRFVGFVVEATEAIPPEQRLRGFARFVGPTSLQVDQHTLIEARAVVLATGSSPFVPPLLRELGDRLWINDTVFEQQDLPQSVAVFGSGVIGLELGQALSRLGVRVQIFNRSDRVGPFTDPVVQQKARDVLGAELDLNLSSTLLSAKADDTGVTLQWRDRDGNENQSRVDVVLSATGRQPNLSKLNLEASGVDLDQRGVPLFNPMTMQCGEHPIFVAGDVTADRPILHEASDEGQIAGCNAALFPNVRAKRRRTALSIVFSDPQMAVVGKRFIDLDPQDTVVGEVSYDDQGRARVMGKNSGHVRIYCSMSSCCLVGAEMFGPRVEHTAHLIAWVMQSRLTIDQILELPVYHPVVEEGIRTAFRDLAARVHLASMPVAHNLDQGPGA